MLAGKAANNGRHVAPNLVLKGPLWVLCLCKHICQHVKANGGRAELDIQIPVFVSISG